MGDKKCVAVDEYISHASIEVQDMLKSVRNTILETAPEAKEMIRSGIPSYNLYGRPLAYFLIAKNHIGFFVDANVIIAFSEKLTEYEGSKAGIHIAFDKPIPHELLKEMILMKASDNQRKAKKKPTNDK